MSIKNALETLFIGVLATAFLVIVVCAAAIIFALTGEMLNLWSLGP